MKNIFLFILVILVNIEHLDAQETIDTTVFRLHHLETIPTSIVTRIGDKEDVYFYKARTKLSPGLLNGDTIIISWLSIPIVGSAEHIRRKEILNVKLLNKGLVHDFRNVYKNRIKEIVPPLTFTDANYADYIYSLIEFYYAYTMIDGRSTIQPLTINNELIYEVDRSDKKALVNSEFLKVKLKQKINAEEKFITDLYLKPSEGKLYVFDESSKSFLLFK